MDRHRTLPGWTWLLIGLLVASLRPAGAFVLQRDAQGRPLHVDFAVTPTLTYHLGTTGSVRGVLSNEWVNARAAVGQWMAVPGTRIRFQESPTPIANVSQIPVEDGRVDILWVNGGTYPLHPDFGGYSLSLSSAGQVAVTYLFTDPVDTSLILQAIILVRRDLDYTTAYTEATASRPFLETVLLHELGHVLGANHSPLGTATLWWTSGAGANAAAGLSADDVAFAQSVYGIPKTLAGLGRISGTVRVNGAPTLGAMVLAERTNGIVVASTVSRANGTYELAGLPPDAYQLRAVPLDPDAGNDAFLVRGLDLDVTAALEYAQANTAFQPTSPVRVSVAANSTQTRDFNPTPGSPPLRVTEIRQGYQRDDRASGDLALQLAPGTSEAWVGVYIPGAVPSNATLRVTGDGLTFGPTEILAPPVLRSLSLVQVPVRVATNATAGPRTLELTVDGKTALAFGFIEVTPSAPDDNFDGLSDLFQRAYWAPFTQSQAAPGADPDGDGYTNLREAVGGTDPRTSADAPLRLTVQSSSGKILVNGNVVVGKVYQAWTRGALTAPWTPWGTGRMATTETLTWTDDPPSAGERYYQIRKIP